MIYSYIETYGFFYAVFKITRNMKKYFNTHPFAKVGILAIPMLLFSILMEIYFPKANPEGMIWISVPMSIIISASPS